MNELSDDDLRLLVAVLEVTHDELRGKSATTGPLWAMACNYTATRAIDVRMKIESEQKKRAVRHG